MDYSKIDNIELGDVYPSDYPDFCDAYIASADYNGRTMTDEELDELNNDSDFIHEEVLNQLF